MSVDEVREVNRVNADGVVWTAKYAGQQFKKQAEQGGRPTSSFIITSSISAHIVNVPVDQPVSLPLQSCPNRSGPMQCTVLYTRNIYHSYFPSSLHPGDKSKSNTTL